MICKNCGQEQADGIKFCANCGAPMGEPQEPVTAAEPVVEQPAVEQPAEAVSAESAPVLTGKGKGRIAVLAIGAVVAIAVVVLLIKLLGGLFGGSSVKPMVAFVNDDNELQFRANLKEKTESVEVTDESTSSITFSPDGKKLYYLEDKNLYMVKTPVTEKSKPERIARNVEEFEVMETGKVLFCDDDSYQVYEGKESYDLLDRKDVDYAEPSEDGKSFYYVELDSSDRATLYKLDIKKGAKAQKLLEDAYMLYSDPDADVLVYAGKENSDDGTVDVYSCKPGGKGTELVSDVMGLQMASGTKADFYYIKGNKSEVTLYDLVDDDMLAEDQATLSGEEPKYPDNDDYYFSDYIEEGNVVRYVTRSGEERTVAYDPMGYYSAYSVAYDDADRRYNEAYNAYYDAYKQWDAARDREEAREELKAETYGKTTYDLYHYNGKASETPVVNGVTDLRNEGIEDGILIYKKTEQKSAGKVIKMSDVELYRATYDVRDAADYGDDSGSDDTWYVNVGGAESELDVKSGTSIRNMYVLDGKEVVLDLYEGDENVLKAFAVKGKGLEELGELASENYSVAGYNYRKDTDKEKGKTLYFYDGVKSGRRDADFMSYTAGDKGKAKTVVEDAEIVWMLEDGSVYVRTDKTELSVVKKGDAKEIVDDLNEYPRVTFLKGGKFLYINDAKELMYYNGKESVRLEKDVKRFVTTDAALDYISYNSPYYDYNYDD